MKEEQSKQLGAQIQFFMSKVTIPAVTAEQRETLQAYMYTMGELEKIVSGELVIALPADEDAKHPETAPDSE